MVHKYRPMKSRTLSKNNKDPGRSIRDFKFPIGSLWVTSLKLKTTLFDASGRSFQPLDLFRTLGPQGQETLVHASPEHNTSAKRGCWRMLSCLGRAMVFHEACLRVSFTHAYPELRPRAKIPSWGENTSMWREEVSSSCFEDGKYQLFLYLLLPLWDVV